MNLTSRLTAKLLLFITLASALPVVESAAASASEWRRLRESARATAKANDYDGALQQYQLAFQEAAAAFKGSDMRFLETVAEAAHFHVQFRRFDEAIEMYQAALERIPKAKGGEQSYKAAFLTAIGQAHMYARRLDEAAQLYRQAIDYSEDKLGDQSPQLADALEGLASVHIERQQPDEALRLLKRALHIAANASRGFAYFDGVQLRSSRGNPSTSEISIQNTIGILHLGQSNYVDAEKAFRDALKTINRQRAEGDVNFIKANTANLERNLAQSYRGQREFDKAEEALFRSIAITEKLQGAAVATAQSLAILAAMHFDQNDAGLDKLFARLTSKKSSPENFLPYTEAIARQYSIRDWSRTESFLQKAIAAAPQYSAELNALGARLAAELKQPEGAKRFLIACVAALEKSGNGSSVMAMSPMKDLADLEAAAGNNDAAARLHEKIVAIARAQFGAEDTRTANALDDLANHLEKSGKSGEAESIRSEANKVRAAALQVD